MGKIKFGIGDNSDSELGDQVYYDGEVPPRGIYQVAMKRLAIKENKNGDPMLNGILEIAESGKKNPKKEFNGYGIWFNLNVTSQGAPWVNDFLNAFGFNKKKFWGDGAVVDESNDPPLVTKIGGKAVKDGMQCRVSTKRGSWNGEDKLDVVRFLPLSDEDGDEDDDAVDRDRDSDDREPPF